MRYSLSEAAKATGKNKTTIQRAIKSGRISANKGDAGSYEIDPSELHRAFPIIVAQPVAQHGQSNESQQGRVAPRTLHSDLVPELERELAVVRERNAGLEEQKRQMVDTIDDLRRRLDSSEGRVTALLADQRPLVPPRRWWQRLR